MKENPTIAIIGLGYVGLPLAVAFAEKYKVIGFDINKKRVEELKIGDDKTLEISKEELLKVQENNSITSQLIITDTIEQIAEATIYVVTVPTPTNKYNQPVLTPLIKASELSEKY